MSSSSILSQQKWLLRQPVKIPPQQMRQVELSVSAVTSKSPPALGMNLVAARWSQGPSGGHQWLVEGSEDPQLCIPDFRQGCFLLVIAISNKSSSISTPIQLSLCSIDP
jgi:hypothetical protein